MKHPYGGETAVSGPGWRMAPTGEYGSLTVTAACTVCSELLVVPLGWWDRQRTAICMDVNRVCRPMSWR